MAERNVAIDHMTEVGVEACRERDARIAELEAENEKNYRKWQDEILRRAVAEGRAEQAEAELAALKEVGATFVLDCISRRGREPHLSRHRLREVGRRENGRVELLAQPLDRPR